jgi:hypothetical protein
MTNEEKEREEKGIAAIIYLQSLAGLTETEEEARKGWRAMHEAERQGTLTLHAALLERRKKLEQEDGEACPTCTQPTPAEMCDGYACTKCGHVFVSPKFPGDK